MANNSYTQQALAAEPQFRARVSAALATVSFQVILEGRDNANEIKRYDYAMSVLSSLDGKAASIAPWLVERTNLLGAETSYEFSAKMVITAATDGAIESQLYTDWNILAGVVS